MMFGENRYLLILPEIVGCVEKQQQNTELVYYCQQDHVDQLDGNQLKWFV